MQDRQHPSSMITNHTMNPPEKSCKNKNIINKDDENHDQDLIPGLPDHLAQLCLSNVQPSLLYDVCMSWRNFVYSPNFPPFFSLYALVSRTALISSSANSVQGRRRSESVGFFCFDTVSSKWRPLPSPPSESPPCFISQHPSFISRVLPIQSITTSGRLVLVAGTRDKFLPALTHPLVFDPLTCKWCYGPPFTNPRRWCVTGSIHGAIYIASGVGTRYQSEVARSVQKWDMSKKESCWDWENKASLRHGTIFSREAVEALRYRGKLCMVNIKGKMFKRGLVYDAVRDQWEEMPRGMREGWNGPATVDDDDDDDNGVMYVVDQENGSLRKYDADNDRWEVVVESSENLEGAEHISAHRGKIGAASGNGGKIVVVDILTRPPKIWTLSPPQETEAIAVHILPRMVAS